MRTSDDTLPNEASSSEILSRVFSCMRALDRLIRQASTSLAALLFGLSLRWVLSSLGVLAVRNRGFRRRDRSKASSQPTAPQLEQVAFCATA